jgi:beta-glucosidase
MNTLKKWSIAAGAFLLTMALPQEVTAQKKLPYMNKALSAEQRTADLMSRMTIDEKIAQMEMVAVWDSTALKKNGMFDKDGVGAWIGDINPAVYNKLQKMSETSRLKIPYLFGIDAPHGLCSPKGRTMFPSSITMAASFNPDLVYRCAQKIAEEVRASGSHWTFSPCVDIVQDARWGRTGETYGECPFLSSSLVTAYVKGMQGNLGANNILVSVKHLYGGGATKGGQNHSNAEISERMARNVFLRPFKAAVDAGAATIMPGHNDVNGIPNHANHWLLTDVVKNEWKFGGFYITDMCDVENLLSDMHRTADCQKEAVRQGFTAGLDMHMYSLDKQRFINNMKALYQEGKISQERIDDACRRILLQKFRLGLFDNRYIDEKVCNKKYGSKEALDLSLDAARQCVVLLKNKDNILPLDTKKYQRILVTGPDADNQTINGDWSAAEPDEQVTTILEGLRSQLDAKITYVDCGRMKASGDVPVIATTDPATQKSYIAKGGAINNMSISQAVDAAKKNDLAIIVIGGNGLRYQWGERTYGESCDRPSIDFFGRQAELVQKIAETGIPYIVVIVNGKPLNNEWVTEHASAMLDAWEPGMYGGQAVGEIIAGKVNPSGKLPITIPKFVGQLPMYYYQSHARFYTGYGLGSSREDDKPAFCFGHGLSYTSFTCEDAAKGDSTVTADKPFVVRAVVKNTGSMDGYATVMAFLNDEVSSVVTPMWMMCGFQKVWLKQGETKTVEIEVPFDSFKLWNGDMHFVAEPGYFNMKVGFSFDDVKFKKRVKL